MVKGPTLFSVDACIGNEHSNKAHLFSLYPTGENGEIVAVEERRLNRQYPDTYKLKPVRMARAGENLVARASVDCRRGEWADILYIAHAKPLVGALCLGRRVVEALKSERVKSYDSFPIEFEVKKCGSGLPKGAAMPEYVAVRPHPGLEVVKADHYEVTPKRHPTLNAGVRNKRLLPKDGTWTGADLCRTHRGQVYCTRRVLELAREYRWTNFEFKPLDVRRDMPTDGIDYLGDNWPPKSWYPPSPSEGKTVEQWVDAFMHNSRKAIEESRNPQPAGRSKRLSRRAREKEFEEFARPDRALTYDLAAEAAPLFIDIVQRSRDELDQNIAARMLLKLAGHTRLDPNMLGELLLPIFERSLRKGEQGFGQSTIVLNSYIEVPEDILALAHKATGKPSTILPCD